MVCSKAGRVLADACAPDAGSRPRRIYDRLSPDAALVVDEERGRRRTSAQPEQPAGILHPGSGRPGRCGFDVTGTVPKGGQLWQGISGAAVLQSEPESLLPRGGHRPYAGTPACRLRSACCPIPA